MTLDRDAAFLESYRLRELARTSDAELRNYYIEQAEEQETIAYA